MTENPEASVLTATRAAQHFRLFRANDAYEHLCILPLLPSLAPLHLMLADTPWPHGFGATLASVGPLSEGFERSVASPLHCSSLVKDLGPCAKGRATDTPRLVWHRGVPVSKSRRASRVSLPARRGCASPHGDYVSSSVPSTSGQRVSKSLSRWSPRWNNMWIR